MSEHSKGGMVCLNAQQSKTAAEHMVHAMTVMREEMDKVPFLTQRIECAKTIAELGRSLKTIAPIFWDNEEVEE